MKMTEKNEEYNTKYKCQNCGGTVFKIIGFFMDREVRKTRIQCANHECHRKKGEGVYDINELFVEIIEKGLQCPKCKEYQLDRDWNKNTRGYNIKCFHCGFVDFDPE